MIKNILFIIAIIVFTLAEISLIWSMPYPLNLVFLPIHALVFFIIFNQKKYTWFFIFCSGFIFDIFTFKPLGTYVLIFIILYLLGSFLSDNYLTNRSFISTALMAAALVVSFESMHYLLDFAISGIELLNFNEFKVFLYSLLVNLCGIVIIYWSMRAFAKIFKFSPRFYEKI